MQKTKTDIDEKQRTKRNKQKTGKHAQYYCYINACFILYIRIMYIYINTYTLYIFIKLV